MPTKRLICFTLYFISILLLPAFAQNQKENSFPFVGEITTDRVNIRAGANTNFEKVGILNKGDQVFVLEASYHWYKIKNPSSVENYVIKKYVNKIDEGEGEIVTDGVNVRARAGVENTAVAQLSKGTRVKILEEVKDWYRIEPPQESFGWISDQFVVFKSKDVSSLEGQRKEEKAKTETSIVTQGLLQKIFSNGDARYQLVVDGQSICSLKGVVPLLDQFVDHRVEVEGIMEPSTEGQSIPVLIVRRLQLVL